MDGELPLPEAPDFLSELSSDLKTCHRAWQECLNSVRTRVNSQSFKTWFEPIVPLRLEEGNFTIQVPSQFFYEWVEEHHYSLITEVLTQILGRECALSYEVLPEENQPSLHAAAAAEAGAAPLEGEDDDPDRPPFPVHSGGGLSSQFPISLDRPGSTGPAAGGGAGGSPFSSASHHQPAPSAVMPTLNPRYTFENYIKGESNQFARAAASAVANNPGGTSFNPLVIYGGVGLGKTHLVHAIGNHLLQFDKRKRVIYTSSEKFTVDFVEAIQKDRVSDFSNLYRSVDLLIVDDIQFFAGKEKTQDSFFHTFNTLHHMGKQIVLSSDRPPKELKGLNERLISRFQWGLTADIQPPDLETRIAILRKKSGDDGIELSHDVVEFIASNVTSNIRELEGCLISLLARSSLENRPVSLDLARDVVRSIIGEVRTHITIEEIQRVVCDHLKIPEDLLRAKTRKQEVVNARQISMYLAKELTNSSLKTIGLHFGGRDHSTVIHAYQTVEDSMNVDTKQRKLVQQLRSKLELSIH